MLPKRHRGQRWRTMLPSVESFVPVPIVIIISSVETSKLTEGGVTSSAPTFVPVDAQGGFVLMCDYTGKEVVE